MHKKIKSTKKENKENKKNQETKHFVLTVQDSVIELSSKITGGK